MNDDQKTRDGGRGAITLPLVLFPEKEQSFHSGADVMAVGSDMGLDDPKSPAIKPIKPIKYTWKIAREYASYLDARIVSTAYGDKRVKLATLRQLANGTWARKCDDSSDYYCSDPSDAIETLRVMAGGHPSIADAEAHLTLMTGVSR